MIKFADDWMTINRKEEELYNFQISLFLYFIYDDHLFL